MSFVLICCTSSRYFKVTKPLSFTTTLHVFISIIQTLLEKGVGNFLPFCCLHTSKWLKKNVYAIRSQRFNMLFKMYEIIQTILRVAGGWP